MKYRTKYYLHGSKESNHDTFGEGDVFTEDELNELMYTALEVSFDVVVEKKDGKLTVYAERINGIEVSKIEL